MWQLFHFLAGPAGRLIRRRLDPSGMTFRVKRSEDNA